MSVVAMSYRHLSFSLHSEICIYRPKHNIFPSSRESYFITDFHQRLCRWMFSDLYMKSIKASEVDVIYNEDVFIKYKDLYFQLFADKISRNAVLADSYMIWTDSEHLAQEYIFEKKEQFVYTKCISREEIEAVKIVKKPVLDFKDIEQSEEILEGNALDNWLFELI